MFSATPVIEWNKFPKSNNKFYWIDDGVEKKLTANDIYKYASHLAYFITEKLKLDEHSIVLLLFEPGYEFLITFLACIMSKTIPTCVTMRNLLNTKEIIDNCNPSYTFISSKIDKLINNELNSIFLTDNIDLRFNNCIQLVNSYKSLLKLNVEKMWNLYSFYKQSMFGDVNIKKPPMYNYRECSKWEKWNDLKGIEKQNAKVKYCECVKKILLETNINKLLIPTDYYPVTLEELSELKNLRTHKHKNFYEDDVVFLQYSSGSTKTPKGVMITQKNIFDNVKNILNLQLSEVKSHKILNWLPHYHDMGLIGHYLSAYISSLYYEDEVDLYSMSPQYFIKNTNAMLDFIYEKQITTMSLPNFAFNVICDNFDNRSVNLSSLQMVGCGSEKIRINTINNFINTFQKFGFDPNSLKYYAYGLAENTLICSYGNYSDEVVDNTISVGKPIEDTEVIIFNQDTNKECREMETGLVYISGNSVARGYYNNEIDTRKTFLNKIGGKNYLNTGDLGFFKNGNLYINGRNAERIIINGRNYYPEDIEETLNDLSIVNNNFCCAFSIDVDNEERLVLLIEVGDQLPSFDIIRTSIYRVHGITPHIISYVSINAIEKTTSGKNRRSCNKEKWLNNEFNIITSDRDFSENHKNAELEQVIVQDFGFVFNKICYAKCKKNKLYELGVNSIDYSKIVQHIKIKSNNHIDIDFQKCYEFTLEELYNLLLYIYDKTSKVDENLLKSDWNYDLSDELREKMARDSIIVQENLPKYDRISKSMPFEPENILLTGSTGFFGNYVLKELLYRTKAKIHLVIRAENEAHAINRVLETLNNNNACINREMLMKRCCPIVGDLKYEKFGIDSESYAKLEETIDVVFHCAASVNYILTYDMQQEHNVKATKNIIDFCFSKTKKELHFCSSTLVFGWAFKKLLEETDNNDSCENLGFGYSQTKWVAERLVLNAIKLGLKAKIYRPPFLTASLTTNGYNEFDIVSKYLQFSLKYRVALDINNNINIMAVDTAAENMVTLSLLDDFNGGKFHLTSSYRDHSSAISDILEEELNIKFKKLNLDEFIEFVNNNAKTDDLLYPLIPFINENKRFLKRMEKKYYSNEITKKCFEKHGLKYTEVDLKTLLRSVIKYLKKKRFVYLL